VESFGRPGGNATGYTLLTNQMETKRVGLLHELVPGVNLFGALINPHFAPTARQLQQIEEATRTIGLHVSVANASNDAELAQLAQFEGGFYDFAIGEASQIKGLGAGRA
jgi:putative tryptophan/tyrosine transport system substrate-binding protein